MTSFKTHRKALAAGSTLILALTLAGVLTLPASGGGACTRTGTNGRDRIVGTSHADSICLKDGRDYASAKAASDKLVGGEGSDSLVGGLGADAIHGGAGNDELFATDGGTNDTLDCGSGFDNAYGDRGDTFYRNCEHIVRV